MISDDPVVIHAVADDLSGAAEVAVLLETRTLVVSGPARDAVCVTDLDARHLPADEVAARVRAALVPGARVFVKIDSLLRGPVAALVGAVGPVVVAPALPTLSRHVVDGVVSVSGRPLGSVQAWSAGDAPASVTAALAPLATTVVPLAVVRSAGLADVVRAAVADGVVPVCDATTDADLDAIIAAVPDGVALAGSGGLAAALGRALRAGAASGPPESTLPASTDRTGGSPGVGPDESPTHAGKADESPTRSAEPGEKAARQTEPSERATRLTEPSEKAARRTEPSERATRLTEPSEKAARRTEPSETATRLTEPGHAVDPGTPVRESPVHDPRVSRSGPVSWRLGSAAHPLVVVGTAEASALAQVRRLVATGATDVAVPVGVLIAGADPAPVHTALRRGPVVLRPTGDVDPARSRDLAAALARLAADVVRGTTVPLALTGGETARHVLDALGVRTLHPIDSVHHGAVRSRTDDGRLVVTRPGSFGDPGSLISIVAALRGGQPTEGISPMTSTTTPLIAVTMGDGAGVGPEVVVGALVEPRDDCRPVVVGDAARLRAAAEVLGRTPEIVTVERVSDAVFTPGRINVLDLGLLPADLPWGKLSSVAGNAAYEYVRVAAELAMAGEVQGICTAPLNKEAMHAAGHRYPGHTELLAHFCGVEEVSMMLSTPTVRVIHVTTHIGLIDAVNRIEPGLVERTVRRGHDALRRAGVEHPRIGVCGINPHAGEGGLFGYGEEEEKIVPAIERLRAAGIDAHGPLPADTAFFVAGRGDYDLVVAMYHDQGHGPVKILGIEAGVNITVGLPVIRTSVDHGTAFDIAGTGKVDVRSMIEALRQAAQMSPRPAGN